jgi:hypothetical protein
MQFDSSIAAQKEVMRSLSLDPRMIRYSVLKVGSNKLGTKRAGDAVGVEGVDGTIPWRARGNDLADFLGSYGRR